MDIKLLKYLVLLIALSPNVEVAEGHYKKFLATIGDNTPSLEMLTDNPMIAVVYAVDGTSLSIEEIKEMARGVTYMEMCQKAGVS